MSAPTSSPFELHLGATTSKSPIGEAQASIREAASAAMEKFRKDTGCHITGISIDVMSRKDPRGIAVQSTVVNVSVTIS